MPTADSVIARAIPADREARWESYGFLSEYGDSQGRRDTHKPFGTLGRVEPRSRSDSIHVAGDTMDDERAWAGFSGSPVFCSGKSLAFVREANLGRRGASLSVVFLPNVLKAVAGPERKSLAALLGVDLDEEFAALRDWFVPLFVRILERPESAPVKQAAMGVFNQLNPGAGIADVEQLAGALLESTPQECVVFMEALYNQLQAHASPAQDATLQELAVLMLCLVFPGQVAIKTVNAQRRRGVPIIEGETAAPLDTEIAMAAADRRQPEIRYRKG